MEPAEFDHVETTFLVAGIATAPDGECRNIVTALSVTRDAAIPLLKKRFSAADVVKDATPRARLAIVALHLGEFQVAVDLCRIAEDPTPGRNFEETLVAWNAGLKDVVEQTMQANDGPLRAAVCLGLGRMKSNSLPDLEREAATQFLLAAFQHAPDTGTHGAADWALRQWKIDQPQLADASVPSKDRDWYVNSLGMSMLRIPAGEFLMGSEVEGDAKPVRVALSKAFFLADREVRVEQFQQFVDDPETPASEKPEKWGGADKTVSLSDAHPVQQVSWYDAVLYCNWLSRQEGRMPAYERMWEWVIDSPRAFASDAVSDPSVSSDDQLSVVRGACFRSLFLREFSSGARNRWPGSLASDEKGFRVVCEVNDTLRQKWPASAAD